VRLLRRVANPLLEHPAASFHGAVTMPR
jgi:hypothetical protein